MENIYKPSEFRCTELVNPDEHFKAFSSVVLQTNPVVSTFHQSLSFLLGDVKRSRITQLKSICSIDKLNCGEPKVYERPDTVLSAHVLNTKCPVTEASLAKLETVATKVKFTEDEENSSKYREQVRHEFETQIIKRDGSSKPYDLTPNKDVLYSIRVHIPFFYRYSRKNNSKSCRYSHEIVALGSNTLADVRDKILCRTDIGICKEVDVPTYKMDPSSVVSAQEIYPSNFIFIENVFYNDFRHPKAIDYSKVVLEWAEKWKVGKFTTAEMDKVKLSELKLRLGYPYVYQHQADCEHILCFSDVRLLNSSDFRSSKDYPYYKSFARYSSQYCMMCGLHTARWICVGSERLPDHNTYLCQECCLSFNYVDGRKVDDVKIYPYFDRSTVL